MEQSKGLTGTQKTALLLITLGTEASSTILKKLPEAQIKKITYEIAKISSIKTKEKEEILNEFLELSKARDYTIEGGIDYAKSLLSKAFGMTKASDILSKLEEINQFTKPFELARKADSNQILNALIYEHPQTIALVLCYIQPEKAAKIISELPEKIQSDVAYRIVTMNNTSPIIVKEIEKILDDKLSNIIKTDTDSLGGINTLVDILNEVDRNTEKNITECLEMQNKELAEIVKNSMFVFEDITKLDDNSIQRILKEVDNKELTLALKACSEEISAIVFKNLSKKAGELLKEEIEYMGPIKLVEVEKAQQKIANIIRKLEEEGEVVISRGVNNAIFV